MLALHLRYSLLRMNLRITFGYAPVDPKIYMPLSQKINSWRFPGMAGGSNIKFEGLPGIR